MSKAAAVSLHTTLTLDQLSRPQLSLDYDGCWLMVMQLHIFGLDLIYISLAHISFGNYTNRTISDEENAFRILVMPSCYVLVPGDAIYS